MIRSHFGLDRNPFGADNPALLPHQQEIFDTLRVHCQQGGAGSGQTCVDKKMRHGSLWQRNVALLTDFAAGKRDARTNVVGSDLIIALNHVE